MKTALRRFAQISLCLTLGLCGAIFSVRAQHAEQYIISAKAGGVNLVSGSVSVRRKGETEWRQLAPQSAQSEVSNTKTKNRDDLFREREAVNSGDQMRTEETGRLEVLLNPGSYLRLAENSEAEMVDTQLDSLRLKLIKGSAIVEITGSSDVKIFTEVITPQTSVSLVRTGLYRFNVVPSKSTELVVYKGRAVIGTGELVTVKGGKKIVVMGGGLPEIVKVDKKNQDSFDFWSKSRSETLVAANSRLSDQALSNAILSSGMRPLRTGAGLWVYDPFFRSHTFFPYYSGWNSPYGRGYHSSFGYSSDLYHPRSPSIGANPLPAGNPSIANPSDGRNIRERKNQIRDELPIRPAGSEMRNHRSERMESLSPRERSPETFQNNRRDDSFRNSAPARQESPTYSSPSSPQPSRERNPDGGGHKQRSIQPLR